MEKWCKICVIVLIVFLDQTKALKCYRCTVLPPSRSDNRTQQLCSDFEESRYFTVDCPYSTMCMKRIFQLKLLNGDLSETVVRDCANQKNTEQVFKNGAWHKEYSIEEPYNEGCEKNLDGSTYCHCRGTLCNSGSKVELTSYHTDAMAVIFAFNLMKYIRNMDY